MGNNTLVSNPLFEGWKSHPSLPHVFINPRNKKHVRRHLMVLQEREEHYLTKRMNQTHNYLAKVEYFQALEMKRAQNSVKQQVKYQIFTNTIHPIIHEKWVPVDSALIMLRGFRRLSTSYGYFRVCQDMISMDQKYEIKVWLNPNPILSRLWQPAESEQKMLADITSIMMKYDSQTGSLMAGCQNLNEAMNNILMNLPENRMQSHLSSRTVTHDYGLKKNKNASRDMESKNIFRSTKETQDQYPKPVKNLNQLIQKNQSIFENKKIKNSSILLKNNLLHNVQTIKKPVYLQNFKPQTNSEIQTQKYLHPEHTQVHKNLSYQQQKEMQKSSEVHQASLSIQLNNSQPININSKKIQPRDRYQKKHLIPNSNTFLTHFLSPVGNQTRKITEQGFKEALNPTSHQNRKTNLNRDYIQKMEQGRPSNVIKYHKLHQNHPQQQQTQLPNKNAISANLYRQKLNHKIGTQINDISRNRTQEFQYIETHRNWKQHTKNRYDQNKLCRMEQSTINANNRKNQAPCNYSMNIHKKQYEKDPEKQTLTFKKDVMPPAIIINNKLSTLKEHHYYKDDLFASHPGTKEQTKSVSVIKVEKRNSQPITPVDQSPKQSLSNTYEQKKALKQKLAKKLREQLGGVLGTVSLVNPAENVTKNSPELKYDKSAKDIQIMKKVEDKKKHFAELKCEALKLLID